MVIRALAWNIRADFIIMLDIILEDKLQTALLPSEVKPANQTDYDQNKAKWASAHDWALNHGWNFIVMTEVGKGQLLTKINRQKAARSQA